LHGGGKQAGALHADADDAEAEAVAGGDRGVAGGSETRVAEEKSICGDRAGGARGLLQEFAAREIVFHFKAPRTIEFKSSNV